MRTWRALGPAALLLFFAAACSDGVTEPNTFEAGVEQETTTQSTNTPPSYSHGDGPLVEPTSNPNGEQNPTCSAALGSGWSGHGERINFGTNEGDLFPQVDGTYETTLGGLEVKVTLSDGARYVAFETSAPIDAFIVKGGPNANLYDYRPIGGTDHDHGLVSPVNQNSGQIPAVSHVDFCFQRVLAVSKTADTRFDRTWTWGIDKDVDVDLPLDFGEGDILTANYTVEVSATSADDNYAVTGFITIHNPWGDDATITGISDILDDGTIASVDCGEFSGTLAGGATLECSYTATPDDDSSELNTVTVTTSGDIGGGTATADVDWATADIAYIDRCVDVTDILTVNGIAQPEDDYGSVCADEDGEDFSDTIEYTHTFGTDGADFALACEDNTVTNVATFVTNTTATTGSDNAGFEIFVVCEEPEEPEEPQVETAWAANGDEPGSLRYTQRGNWATYVEYSGAEKTVTFFAGQNMNVGTVTFSAVEDGKVTITINLGENWEFLEGEVVAVQDYATAPSGNPAPGRFDHKESATGTLFSITVPENSFYGVHGVVSGFPDD
jgi:hypothetical protein